MAHTFKIYMRRHPVVRSNVEKRSSGAEQPQDVLLAKHLIGLPDISHYLGKSHLFGFLGERTSKPVASDGLIEARDHRLQTAPLANNGPSRHPASEGGADMMKWLFGLAAAGSAVSSTSAYAAETVTYTYDALGRLIGSQISSGPANGVATTIQYDAADNRSNYTVTGASNTPPGQTVIVVPLNGFTVIPLINSWMLP